MGSSDVLEQESLLFQTDPHSALEDASAKLSLKQGLKVYPHLYQESFMMQSGYKYRYGWTHASRAPQFSPSISPPATLSVFTDSVSLVGMLTARVRGKQSKECWSLDCNPDIVVTSVAKKHTLCTKSETVDRHDLNMETQESCLGMPLLSISVPLCISKS